MERISLPNRTGVIFIYFFLRKETASKALRSSGLFFSLNHHHQQRQQRAELEPWSISRLDLFSTRLSVFLQRPFVVVAKRNQLASLELAPCGKPDLAMSVQRKD
jgi:hypothetical protein